MSISENLLNIKNNLPEQVTLVAVSKTKPNSDIMEAYNVGQRIFGENKVQDLCTKYETLPKDIEWHFIGHLQTNKIKYLAPFISLIHGVDSIKLLKAINKEALKNNRVINCLLQIHLGEEETKFGMDKETLFDFFKANTLQDLSNINICGLMGMATNTDDKVQIKEEFNSLTKLFNLVKQEYLSDNPDFKDISMGMSGDYPLAIKCGSTMVRVGSSIFGARQYL